MEANLYDGDHGAMPQAQARRENFGKMKFVAHRPKGERQYQHNEKSYNQRRNHSSACGTICNMKMHTSSNPHPEAREREENLDHCQIQINSPS